MTRQLRLILSSLLTCTLVCSVIGSSGAETAANSNQSTTLKGKAAAFGILSEEIQARLGFKCASNEEEDIVISDVVPGTAASDCVLEKGDVILDAQLEGNALNITIQREGRIFKARLRELSKTAPTLVAQKAKMDNTPIKPFTLNAEQSVMHDNQLVPEQARTDKAPKPRDLNANRFALEADKNLRLLADYNMELIVDRSRSMHKPDCPDGLSRWQWCGTQATQLAQALSPYTPNGLTIIPFATEYDVFEHANAKNIDYLFNNMQLQDGTRLFEPITERLDNYFAHHKPNSKPLLIVVITDGVPVPKFEPALVKNELIEASQKMTSPGEVTVIFCQIGGQDRFGQRYLKDLDENLVSYGARYHFIHTIPFDVLEEMGIGPALVSCMREFAPMTPPAPKTIAKPGSPPPRTSNSGQATGHSTAGRKLN